MIRLSDIRQYLGAVFFSQTCPTCGTVLESDDVKTANQHICQTCLNSLERTEQFALRGNLTEDLFAAEDCFERAAAYCFYDKGDKISRLVQYAKYSRHPELIYELAHAAALDGLQSDFFDGIDVIIPIPLHPRRYRQRGYNQSDYIAQALSQVLHIPVDTTHIARIRNNPQQALSRGKDRRKNVEGIFAVNHPEEMYRKHILLVDDVITTGSTIRSCMEAMQPFRGARVSVFAISKAR